MTLLEIIERHDQQHDISQQIIPNDAITLIRYSQVKDLASMVQTATAEGQAIQTVLKKLTDPAIQSTLQAVYPYGVAAIPVWCKHYNVS